MTSRLGRYKDLAWFVAKYGRADFVTRALHGEEVDTSDPVEAARTFASDLESLGPTFIKLGQLLSTRPDVMPANYIEALSRLQSTVAPVSAEKVTAIIESELGTPISELFASFDC